MGAEDEGGEGMVREDLILTDGCPTDLTDTHGYYSVGLTKTILTQISLITLILNKKSVFICVICGTGIYSQLIQ